MAQHRSEKEILEHAAAVGLTTPERKPTTLDGIMACCEGLGCIMQQKLPPDVGFVMVLFLKGEPQAFGLAASPDLPQGKIMTALYSARDKLREKMSSIRIARPR